MSDPNQQFHPPPPPAVEAEPERRRVTNLLWAGIGLFVVGIIILILSILNIFPGAGGMGGALFVLGVMFIGFSFMRLPAIPDAPPPMSTVGALTGIFFEPTNVFRNLRAHPKWVAPILLAGVLNGAYLTAFYARLTPDRIVNFTYEKLADSPIKPPPEAMETARVQELEKQKSIGGRIGRVVTAICSVFFGVAFVAALMLLGTLAFGGRMHYWQAFSVMAFVIFPVTLIQKAISLIILYLKSPDDIHPLIGQETLVYDNLGLLVSSKDHPVIYVTLAAIGVLALYRLWLFATGVREGGYKVSNTAAWSVAISVFVLFLLFGMAAAAIFPSFLG